MMAKIKCWLGSFEIFQVIWTSITNKPYIFVIFQGGGGKRGGGGGGSGPPVTPLDPPMRLICEQ